MHFGQYLRSCRLCREMTQESLVAVGMQNIINESKSKKLILDFPSSMMSIDDLKICELRDLESLDRIVSLNTYLDKDYNKNLTGLESEDFNEGWRAAYREPRNSLFYDSQTE